MGLTFKFIMILFAPYDNTSQCDKIVNVRFNIYSLISKRHISRLKIITSVSQDETGKWMAGSIDMTGYLSIVAFSKVNI